jgi:hypothetical protein
MTPQGPSTAEPSLSNNGDQIMITSTSLSDLDQLAEDDPARPVVSKLLGWLIADGQFPDHPYDPDDHG